MLDNGLLARLDDGDVAVNLILYGASADAGQLVAVTP